MLYTTIVNQNLQSLLDGESLVSNISSSSLLELSAGTGFLVSDIYNLTTSQHMSLLFCLGFLATFLSVFAIPTFAAPNNVVVNQLFGGWTGLSLLPLTLDWTQIAGYVGSPLIPPWHAISNTMIGVVVFYLIAGSAIHFSGTWYAKFLPIRYVTALIQKATFHSIDN